MAVKTSKSTTKRGKQAKAPCWYDTFKFMNSWSEGKVSDTFIEKLCGELAEHFVNPKNICVYEFTSDRGMNFDHFKELTKRYKKLGSLYQVILQRIGSKREKLAIFKDYNCNPNSLHYTMRHYHPFWRLSFDEEANLKIKAADNSKLPVKVIIEELKA